MSSTNYWAASQRKGHSLHELSYRACFKAELPEFFITRLTRPGDTVYDPFAGRGTTALQAALMSRRPVSNDINPLALLLTRPRLTPPGLLAVAEALLEIDWRAGRVDRPDLLAFYGPSTLQQICALRAWLQTYAAGEHPPPVTDWIRAVSLHLLSGHSPGFFSVRSMPPNQAVSVATQLKLNAKHGLTPPDHNIRAMIMKKTSTLLRDGTPPAHPPALLLTGPAQATPEIPTASVDLVVTSPPFLDTVHYAQDQWLRLWFADIDADALTIPLQRTTSAWQSMVRATFLELARICRPGAHVAFEVGEVRGGSVLLERLVWEALAVLPFERLCVMVNQQTFTKTANTWGVRNNVTGTNSNRIVVARRC
jgi:hypothetical protein